MSRKDTNVLNFFSKIKEDKKKKIFIIGKINKNQMDEKSDEYQNIVHKLT